VFNNYGPKSNEELLLGYGFTLPNNPDDVVTLKLGARRPPRGNSVGERGNRHSGDRYYVRRDGAIPTGLLDEMRALLLASAGGDEEAGAEEERDAEYWERELDLADQLGAMLGLKLQALEASEASIAAALEEDVSAEGGDDKETAKRPRIGDDSGGSTAQLAARIPDGVRPDVLQLVRDYRQGINIFVSPRQSFDT
jgi:hypothetical protein